MPVMVFHNSHSGLGKLKPRFDGRKVLKFLRVQQRLHGPAIDMTTDDKILHLQN